MPGATQSKDKDNKGRAFKPWEKWTLAGVGTLGAVTQGVKAYHAFNDKTAFERGFAKAAMLSGVDPITTSQMLKQAGSTLPATMVGAAGGTLGGGIGGGILGGLWGIPIGGLVGGVNEGLSDKKDKHYLNSVLRGAGYGGGIGAIGGAGIGAVKGGVLGGLVGNRIAATNNTLGSLQEILKQQRAVNAQGY